MPKNAMTYKTARRKRRILVAEDEQINRQILGMILDPEYEVLYAADGTEAMSLIRERSDELSLILLDLRMPGISGQEILQRMRTDPDAARIPVIVMTSEQSAEVECLRLGAIDFIPKPYPVPEVILARVERIIELYEDKEIIRKTERDQLTGLYTPEYFFRYAERSDTFYRELAMDAIVLDVNHFQMINERYGRAYGDDVLRRIGQRLKELVREIGGIVCRREGDTFLLYCPHGKDYRQILDSASVGLAGDETASGDRIRLRMGVYPEVDKNIDLERRFDRAKMAADRVKGSFTSPIAMYDNELHEAELFAEQLLEDFRAGIDEKQFRVYYQPKFDIRGEVPVLSSAEALVRWHHPSLGVITPGRFIPVFEGNGLVRRLDHYVWREVAAQIRDWKKKYGVSVPVSVNISRVDMYETRLVEEFRNMMEEFGLTPEEYLLEITESACTEDTDRIIEVGNRLREEGFRIEMDDFGTGYSSLNMISTLPIDILKLDMGFIRDAFRGRRDVRMLEAMIDIAEYIGASVVAEGVETEEQLQALKEIGCDLVQGYYFSRPVSAEEFEAIFLRGGDYFQGGSY